MLIDNQLREQLHRLIDSLPTGKLHLAEQILSMMGADEPLDTVREDTSEYLPEEKIATNPYKKKKKWLPNEPFSETQEGWFQYFLAIEEDAFTSLEESNQEFEQWKIQQVKNRL